VNDLARATLELVQFRATQANVRIVTEYGEVPTLEIDGDAFKQVLLNLFNNAIDAMPRGGDLRVTTIGERERVGVIVADHGVGMDSDTRARIFTPFFSTRAGTGGGTGLGLSVSLQIVETHGGTIEVGSAPGQGSVFTVWLPTSWPVLEAAVPAPATSDNSPDGLTEPDRSVKFNPDASTQAPAHAASAPANNQDGRATHARDRAHPKVVA
jgi:K+-sensing histidine kinase KdpD